MSFPDSSSLNMAYLDWGMPPQYAILGQSVEVMNGRIFLYYLYGLKMFLLSRIKRGLYLTLNHSLTNETPRILVFITGGP